MARFSHWLRLLPFCLASACAAVPTTLQSRDQMWQQYGGQPVDKLLMALGTPARETRLTDGSRMITYQFNTVYDAGSPYERQSVCEATFVAKPPHFKVDNVAMQGDAQQCYMLAQGHTGSVRHPGFNEPPYSGYPPYGSYPPSYLYHYRY